MDGHFKSTVLGGVFLDNRHLLIMDRHKTHITLNVCRKVASYEIEIALLLLYTTHRLQSLNVSFFKSFKSHFFNKGICSSIIIFLE
jgi:hypothetical protein